MPLVRVDIKKHQDPTHAKRIGQLIYAAMHSAIGVPENDNFQILAEHDEQHFIFDPGYLGINRTDNLVVIQITLSEGRTVEQKKKLVAEITRVSVEILGGSPESVDILITDIKRENWATGGKLWSEPRS